MNNRGCMGIVYVVKRGDTLYNISRQFNVPIETIMSENPYVDVYNLQIGSELCIPVRRPFPPSNIVAYVVQVNESLLDILKKFNIDLEDLLEFNQLESIKLTPGIELQIPVEDEED